MILWSSARPNGALERGLGWPQGKRKPRQVKPAVYSMRTRGCQETGGPWGSTSDLDNLFFPKGFRPFVDLDLVKPRDLYCRDDRYSNDAVKLT